MNSANHIEQDDLYLFALQLLPDTEMKAAALHVKECAPCRAQMGEIQGELVNYAMTAEMQAPPSHTRERLLRQVVEEKKKTAPIARTEQQIDPVLYARNRRIDTKDADAREEREPRRVAPFLAWAGWTVATCVAVLAGLQFDQRKQVEGDLAVATAQLSESATQTPETLKARELIQMLRDANAMQVSLHVPLTRGAPLKLDPEAHATYVPGMGSLVFVASHLDPLLPAKTYELWLLPAVEGQAPVAAGLFKPDGNGNAKVVMPELPKGVAAKGFGVTVEDEGGSKTPTAPIVLAGM
jgi:hypothetical protein